MSFVNDPVLAPGCDDPADPLVLHRGQEPERLHRLLNASLTPHEMDIVGRRPMNAVFRVLHQGAVAVFDLTYGTEVEVRPRVLPDYYTVRLQHRGRAGLTVDDRLVPFSPSIVNPGQAAIGRWSADARSRLLKIPRPLVEDAAVGAFGSEARGTIRFHSAFDPANPASRQWTDLARRFAQLLDEGTLARSPLAVAHFEQTLVHSLLLLHPNNHSEEFAKARGHAGPASLRRALAYCDENASRPISVADIAAAARVGVRTVQELFRVHLDTTPMTYLKRVRLAYAHADLTAVAEGREAATVTEIALRWGFPNRGRFGKAYREAYGRLPSETARVPFTGETTARTEMRA